MRIVAIVPPLGVDGSGHLARMRLLRQRVRDAQWLIFPYDRVPRSLNADIILLDARDRGFPKPAALSGASLVAVDNRGDGRTSADLVLDTLPYPGMSEKEQADALRFCLLPPDLRSVSRKKSFVRVVGSKQEAMRMFRFEKRQALFHGAVAWSEARFRTSMASAAVVYTYFGQTFFEALRCGKDVVLIDISEVHAKLNRMAFENASAWQQVLDSKGIYRFKKIIFNLISSSHVSQ